MTENFGDTTLRAILLARVFLATLIAVGSGWGAVTVGFASTRGVLIVSLGVVAITALAFVGSDKRRLAGRRSQWALVAALLATATALGAVVEPMARVPLAVAVVCLLVGAAATALVRADTDQNHPGSAFR